MIYEKVETSNNEVFRISNDTAYRRQMPEICKIVVGLPDCGPCPECSVNMRDPSGDLRVILADDRARIWPDLIACGDYPCFVASVRFVDAMRECGVRIEKGGRVDFIEPIENGLSLDDSPGYYWLDGSQGHQAGKMDFDFSGYVDVHFCDICSNRTHNISVTFDRQRADPPPPTVFEYDAKTGHDLFTTDLSPCAFFCTERVLEIVKKYKLTNIAFYPCEEGEKARRIAF